MIDVHSLRSEVGGTDTSLKYLVSIVYMSLKILAPLRGQLHDHLHA